MNDDRIPRTPSSAQHRAAAQELLLARFPAVAWTVDPQQRLTSCWGRVLADHDYSEEQLLGRPLTELFAETSDPGTTVAVHQRALGGESVEFLMEWRGRHFHSHLEPLYCEAGEVVGCAGVALDVTERTVEAANAARGARFRLALTSLVEEALHHKVDDRFYSRVVDVALNALKGAHAGTLWLRRQDGRFHAVASIGFDHTYLRDITFTQAEMESAPATVEELEEHFDRIRQREPAKAALMAAAGPQRPIKAMLNLPVSVNGDTTAFLHLTSHDSEDAFTKEEIEMARLFAGNVALLLQRTQLERDLRRSNENLKRLLRDYQELAAFGAEIEAIHDTDKLIDHGMTRLLDTLQFDTALFSDVDGDEVKYSRIKGRSTPQLRETLATPMPVGAGISGLVAESGEALFVKDYVNWPGRHESYVASGLASLLALPIRRGGKVRHTIAFGTLGRQAEMDENAKQIAQGFATRLENAFDRVQHLEEIEATREATFRALGLALEYRDLETRGHTDRVVSLAMRFADEVGLSGDRRRALLWGAYLHDIGKIAVPDHILLKPGRLTEEEFSVIRQHTIYGIEMTREIGFLPTETRQIIRSHHERYDGLGYPDQLAGNEIPLLARMFSIVDVYDALTSERPYKRAWSHEDALAELDHQAGAQFDPQLVRMFFTALNRSEETQHQPEKRADGSFSSGSPGPR